MTMNHLTPLPKLVSLFSTGLFLAALSAGCGSSGHTRVVDADDPSQRLTSKGLDPQVVGLFNSPYSHQTVDVVMTANLLAALPPLVFFLIFQRKIVEGIAMTGSKG